MLPVFNTSLPFVSPLSNHSTVTLFASGFTPLITAECIRPVSKNKIYNAIMCSQKLGFTIQ